MENPVSTGDSYEAALLSAKEYYSNVAKGMGTRIATSDEIQPIEVTPGWDESFLQSKKDINVFEAESEPVGLSFRLFLPEAELAYGETGDSRYLQSNTRFVFRTNKETGEQTMFYMTVLPDPEYVKNSDFKPYDDLTYISRPSDFTGLVLFHNEDGSFSNGWKYEDGKVTQEVVIVDGANEFSATEDESDDTRTTLKIPGYHTYTTCYHTGNNNETEEMMASKIGRDDITEKHTRSERYDDLGCETIGWTTYTYVEVASGGSKSSSSDDGLFENGGGYTAKSSASSAAKSANDPEQFERSNKNLSSGTVKECVDVLNGSSYLSNNFEYLQGYTKEETVKGKQVEHGWIRTVSGNYIFGEPKTNESTGKLSIQYAGIGIRNLKISERFHIHPDGGLVLSIGDWKALEDMVELSQIRLNEKGKADMFYYGIITMDMGYIALTITDYTKFSNLVTSYFDKWSADNLKHEDQYREEIQNNKSGLIGLEESIACFASFLAKHDAGLQLYFLDGYEKENTGHENTWRAVSMEESTTLHYTNTNY